MLFVAKTLKKVWVKMWVNCLTHTVTHIGWQPAALPPTASSCPMGTTKCAERTKEHRREIASFPVLCLPAGLIESAP